MESNDHELQHYDMGGELNQELALNILQNLNDIGHQHEKLAV